MSDELLGKAAVPSRAHRLARASTWRVWAASLIVLVLAAGVGIVVVLNRAGSAGRATSGRGEPRHQRTRDPLTAAATGPRGKALIEGADAGDVALLAVSSCGLASTSECASSFPLIVFADGQLLDFDPGTQAFVELMLDGEALAELVDNISALVSQAVDPCELMGTDMGTTHIFALDSSGDSHDFRAYGWQAPLGGGIDGCPEPQLKLNDLLEATEERASREGHQWEFDRLRVLVDCYGTSCRAPTTGYGRPMDRMAWPSDVAVPSGLSEPSAARAGVELRGSEAKAVAGMVQHVQQVEAAVEREESGTVVMDGRLRSLAVLGQETAHVVLPDGQPADLLLRAVLPNE